MLLAVTVFLTARQALPRPSGVAALPWRERAALALPAFVGASFGAKLPFALGAAGGVFSVEAWLSDGKTLLTGLAGGYLAVEWTKWWLGVRVKTGDTFALPWPWRWRSAAGAASSTAAATGSRRRCRGASGSGRAIGW
jgi:phosphatidylglycerol---prolipoprotein diacylglyceryl transferase